MSNKRLKNMIPQINLKGDDFAKMVPAEHQLDLTLQLKLKGRKEAFDNVHAFALKDGEFKIILRNSEEYVHVIPVKALKAVYIHHNPFANVESENVEQLAG